MVKRYVLVALAIVGCGKEQPSTKPGAEQPLVIKATQAPTPPGAGTLEIDVVTEPGAKLYCVHPATGTGGSTVCPDAVADASGKVHWSIAWPGPPRTDVKISGRAGMKSGEVTLAVSNGQVFVYDGASKAIEAKCVAHACHMVVEPDGLVFDGIEAGATLEVAGKKIEVSADGKATAKFSEDDRLAMVAIEAIAKHARELTRGRDRVNVKLTWKDGTSEEELVTAWAGEAILWSRLAAITKGPVALPGDGATLGKAIAVVSSDPKADIFNRVFGAATKFEDIGRVAVLKPTKTIKKTCGPYGSQSAKLEMTIADADVTIYDRKSGKSTVHKAFNGGSHDCPKEIEVTTMRASYTNVSTFEMTDVDDWLRGQAK